MSTGLSDEAVMEGHDLIDGAEHEAKADPKDFKKVHPVGETGGSILPDPPSASSGAGSAPSAAPSGGSGSANANQKSSAVHALEHKLAELKDKLVPK
ncbi:hypothetical protein SEUCBS139899_008260 [Sporothrix eucalyptigena]|uniref:Uncharacterized protein n=1 Tax=Sporothrix eucalyptigena TaxID=1812306 RepID=A0ABP0CFY3_9PEZI